MLMHATSITAVTAAVLAAGLTVFLASTAPEAKAGIEVASAGTKGDRLVAVKEEACALRSWPYYEQSCQFDLRRSADGIPKVRMIELDRRELATRTPTSAAIARR